MINSPDRLRAEVKQAYSAIAEHPHEQPPFPTGRGLAEDLSYPVALLDALPATAVEAFCGVSKVSLFAEIPAGATVLDLGCGGGMDTLIAARRTGAQGRAIAIDFSQAMLARACRALSEAHATNVELHLADAERLPIDDESIDVAIVNGIFNLNPYRERIFSELARVLKPGGTVYAAELVLAAPLPEAEQQSAADWFS
jgi:arsenite methyltransferase